MEHLRLSRGRAKSVRGVTKLAFDAKHAIDTKLA